MNKHISYSKLRILTLQTFAMLILLLNAACSTVVEGRSQKIAITTEPAGAQCVLKSNDNVISIVTQTPAVIDVQKSKYDIVVECTKEGYNKGKAKNHSDYAISGLGNMALWHLSFVGNMIDSATGAGNKYDGQVFVELEKAPPVITQAQVTTPVQYVAQAAEPVHVASPIVLEKPTQEMAQLYVQQVAQILNQQPHGSITHLVAERPIGDIAMQPPFAVTQ
jgi:hypothetical protein